MFSRTTLGAAFGQGGIEMDSARSGCKMKEVEMLTPSRDLTLSTSWPVLKALTRSLFREIGILRGSEVLLRSNTVGMLFDKPKWHPEHFEFSNRREESAFKELFDILAPTIVLYNDLKKHFGGYLADEITANMAFPLQLALYPQFGWIPDDPADIDQWRQCTADAWGSGAWEFKEWVSEDDTEYRMRFTKCAPVMILKAYGMHAYAENICMTDHVVMDCLVPEVIFSRTCAIGVGDPYCDHTVRLPVSDEDTKKEEDYADCNKARFGGREAVRHWEEVYKRSGKFM